LAREAPAGEEPLRFAAGLYRVQGRMADALEAGHAEDPLIGHLDEDAERLADQIPSVLRYAAEKGPEALSEDARAWQKDLSATARTWLLVYWTGDRTLSEDYLIRAILCLYVELLRFVNVPPDRVHRQG